MQSIEISKLTSRPCQYRWAFAKLNYPLPKALIGELQVPNAGYRIQPQELANTAWAICINGDDEFLKSLIFNCFRTQLLMILHLIAKNKECLDC